MWLINMTFDFTDGLGGVGPLNDLLADEANVSVSRGLAEHKPKYRCTETLLVRPSLDGEWMKFSVTLESWC